MKIYNYTVIGGGISGLLCGHLLDDAIVLEKNIQVGGRTASNKLDKVKIDVGAQFLSKSLAKQLQAEFNLPYLKEVKEPSTVFVINNKKIVYTSFIRFLSQLPISFKKKLDFIRDIFRLYVSSSQKLLNSSGDVFFRESTLDLLRPVILGLTSVNPEKLSSFYIKFLYRNMSERIYTNLHQLIDHLYNELKKGIILDAEVLKVDDKKEYFEVVYKKQNKKQKIFAKKIIFSVPTKELLAKFSNILNKKKINALKKVSYSNCIAISLKIKKNMPYFIYFIDKGPIWSFVNYSILGKDVINLFITGPEAEKFLKMKEEKIKDYAINFLISQNYLNGKISEKDIAEVLITKWKECLPIYDTSYSRFDDILKNSIDDRIFFCGDYTDIPSLEGCVNSVLRVNQEIKEHS